MSRNFLIFSWLLITASISGYFVLRILGEDKTIFVPAGTTSAHHQIEASCESCHTSTFSGVDEKACLDCHQNELDAVEDSHPKKKFRDPRNAADLKKLNVMNCVTCHVEHVPHRTGEMAVTLPIDYCSFCHDDVAEDRPSHEGLAFDTCASAGCHNYHDNTGLYEDFLAAHADEPDHLGKQPAVLLRTTPAADQWESPRSALLRWQHDAPKEMAVNDLLLDEWAGTAHAKSGVNCSDCHQPVLPDQPKPEWRDEVPLDTCRSCHAFEMDTFLKGKHGMRLAVGLSPMTPSKARIPLKEQAKDTELTCSTCHGAHEFSTEYAVVNACLSCHQDEHSLAYEKSPHFELWEKERLGNAPAGTGVTCATCHIPREAHKIDGKNQVLVQHNQNHNYQPNEKMIRSVCSSCHGVAFTIDALADENLIRNNFQADPSIHVRSMDFVKKRMRSEASKKTEKN